MPALPAFAATATPTEGEAAGSHHGAAKPRRTSRGDAPGRIRTSDPRLRRPPLCPLSYRRRGKRVSRTGSSPLTRHIASAGLRGKSSWRRESAAGFVAPLAPDAEIGGHDRDLASAV